MPAGFKKVKTAETEEEEDSYASKEKWRIWKNVLVLGFAFMVQFTAFWGASNLQSSVNADAALGTFTLAAIYASLLLSNILLPAIVIRWFGCKWTIALSLLTYMPFIAAHFYPRFYTMIPGGMFVGLGGGPLWCAKCTYLSVIGTAYATITDVSPDVAITRFFGVFFMFYQLSQVWGNLISSLVLSGSSHAAIEYTNASIASEMVGSFCGANFCPGTNVTANPNLDPPPPSKIHAIAGIYLACMLAACIAVFFGVDSMDRYKKSKPEDANKDKSGCGMLAVTLRQLGNPYQLLIVPITMFIGAEQAFIAADFNASFVSCGWGISNIGFVMICFGVSNAIAAIFGGRIVSKTGRSPMIAFGLVLHVCLLITLLMWRPHSGNKEMYFLISGLWGIADAVWLVHINSFYGILFRGKEEAAYSNFRLWESFGSVITYTYSPYLCTEVKIYLLIGLLLVGVTGYTAVECLRTKRNRGELEIGLNKFQIVRKSEIPQ